MKLCLWLSIFNNFIQVVKLYHSLTKVKIEKRENFIQEFRPEIKKDVRMSKVVDYREIVDKTFMVEHDE